MYDNYGNIFVYRAFVLKSEINKILASISTEQRVEFFSMQHPSLPFLIELMFLSPIYLIFQQYHSAVQFVYWPWIRLSHHIGYTKDIRFDHDKPSMHRIFGIHCYFDVQAYVQIIRLDHAHRLDVGQPIQL